MSFEKLKSAVADIKKVSPNATMTIHADYQLYLRVTFPHGGINHYLLRTFRRSVNDVGEVCLMQRIDKQKGQYEHWLEAIQLGKV